MAGRRDPQAPVASFHHGGTGRGLVELTDDFAALERGGRWAVCVTFEGRATLARFSEWSAGPPDVPAGAWLGPGSTAWRSSLGEAAYREGVARIKDRIAAGDVYQVNLCRTLTAELPDASACDPAALAARLSTGNPAPYGGFLQVPGCTFVCASPELFLRRQGAVLVSGPIKGTATTPEGLSAKDRAENVMIVDLVRNDLARVCAVGSVAVPELLAVEQHPGLVHLVSYVSGSLRVDVSWAEIFEAVFPPGSVSGTPKIAALSVIGELEPVARGPYCGAVGWIDVDAGTAELAVGIRSFWLADGLIHFGTGAGITWGSDPHQEWLETELKASRLVPLASE